MIRWILFLAAIIGAIVLGARWLVGAASSGQVAVPIGYGGSAQ